MPTLFKLYKYLNECISLRTSNLNFTRLVRFLFRATILLCGLVGHLEQSNLGFAPFSTPAAAAAAECVTTAAIRCFP